jgi:hypothetical protein
MGDFFDVLNTPKYDNKQSKVTDYIRLENDKPIKVQLLSPVGTVYTHWMFTDGKKMPFRCLGEMCPVCARNSSVENDEDPDFIKKDRAYIVNVVDLTPMKICPKCENVNEKNATKCSNEECGTVIIDVDPQPLDRVRYLESSWTVFEQIKQTAEALVDQGMDIKSTPLVIRKSKASNDKIVATVIPSPKDEVDVRKYTDNLFDYEKTGIHVNHQEMIILMNGGSFKDILKKRSDNKDKKSELDEIFGEKAAR